MKTILLVIFAHLYASSIIEASILHSSGGLQKRDAPTCGNFIWERGIPGDGKSPQLGEFPWLALLEYKTNKTRENVTEAGESTEREILCGGVLISDRHVLTAAHCLRSGHELVGVRLGEHNTATDPDCESDGEQSWCTEAAVVAAVNATIPHESYGLDNDTQLNDLGIVLLDRPVLAAHIQPICLPSAEVAKQQKFLSAGWGAAPEAGQTAGNLKIMTRATRAERAACDEMYGSKMKLDVFCAATKTNLTACTADSGGALVSPSKESKMMVVGVFVPVDNFCKKDGLPGTYIDVFQHLDWIKNNMR